ncbi:hypothetical protein I4U23_022924 [Adineta vaga]|nr:hypothetical protein I4U23_022924 [Adineta vaga]
MSNTSNTVRILVVGCGNMGAAHAKAYSLLSGFEICGLVSTGKSKDVLNEQLGGSYALFDDIKIALISTKPDAVCISTYPDTHEAFAVMALEHGCHVFIEKPLADTVEGAKRIVKAAEMARKKVVVGYILRHHPSWTKFVELAQGLGKPNIMCQMTRSKPIQVNAIGARLTDEIPENNYNYGQLQIRFADGSIGWYEAGWGPMMSQTAFFVKDVIGPKGCVSIVARTAGADGKSDKVDMHTNAESLRVHHASLNDANQFAQDDTWIDMQDEPDHQELCIREQQYFLKAIQDDLNLTDHLQDAVNSLHIAFACDESVRSGQPVYL